MRRNRRHDASPDSGNDSFLDIVSNLVGILVILIMVVGMRARNAYQAAGVTPTAAAANPDENLPADEVAEAPAVQVTRPLPLEILQSQVAAKNAMVEGLQHDAHDLENKIQQVRHQTELRISERNQLQLLVAAANADLAERREALETSERQHLAQVEQVAAADLELKRLQESTQAKLAAVPSRPKVLEHRSTPLAQMVTGREEHFRLLHGNLVRVPMEEIADFLLDDARRTLWKLKDTNANTETIGPIGGFYVKYTMVRSRRQVKTQTGIEVRSTLMLSRFTLMPVEEPMGRPLSQALAPNSEFREFLQRLDPNDTTITIWTYPDSFSEYRELKDQLQQAGFRVAARPKTHGSLIAGAHDGSRSAAE